MCNSTYSYKGERSTFVATHNPSKCTHSYTAQYTVALDGTLFKKVFLCMQEPNGKFGPRVQATVKTLSEENSRTPTKPAQSWDNWVRPFTRTTWKRLFCHMLERITFFWWWTVGPAKLILKCTTRSSLTTTYCPPPLWKLSLGRVKWFLKRLQNNVTLIEEKREINSREDCIKMHSLIVHQFSATIFQDMTRCSWHASGVSEEKQAFKNVSEVCFGEANDKLHCNCGGPSVFIRCSVCRVFLCYKCFF